MSRIGNKPIQIPESTEIVVEGRTVKASGPKGELELLLPSEVSAKEEDGSVVVERKQNSKFAKSKHGTTARHISNMLHGVKEGWKKSLELVGTGYRARMEGATLVLAVGFSHPVRVEAPQGITFTVEENKVIVEGADKNKVGQTAAQIRAIRPPEPYKGKGIKYEEEVIRRKPGKQAAKAGPAAVG